MSDNSAYHSMLWRALEKAGHEGVLNTELMRLTGVSGNTFGGLISGLREGGERAAYSLGTTEGRRYWLRQFGPVVDENHPLRAQAIRQLPKILKVEAVSGTDSKVKDAVRQTQGKLKHRTEINVGGLTFVVAHAIEAQTLGGADSGSRVILIPTSTLPAEEDALEDLKLALTEVINGEILLVVDIVAGK